MIMRFISTTNVKYDVNIESADTVFLVKEKIAVQINSPCDNIQIAFRCKNLENDKLFAYYNIPSDESVLFYLIKERIIKNNKGAPIVFQVCLCGDYHGKSCKSRPISLNIFSVSRGIIYNIRTTAGTKIIDGIRSSPFKDIWGSCNRLVYNDDYIDEERCFIDYNLQNNDIIKELFCAQLLDNSNQASPMENDDMQLSICRDDDGSVWELMGLNKKRTCVTIWINFRNNNYEYFTVRECLDEITADRLITRISNVFDIPVERIKIFRDKNQQYAIKDKVDVDSIISDKHKRKYFLKGNGDPSFESSIDSGDCNEPMTPSSNRKKRLSGYQYSINVYYSFVPDIERIIIQDKIGEGSFGILFKCVDIDSNQTLALKKFKFLYDECIESPHIDIEIDILCALGSHPRIVKFERRIIAENILYILMEYAPGGSLKNYIVKHEMLPESLIALYSGQILEALEYLHGHKIIHRDIKSENILLDAHYNVKLADFGLSKRLINRASQSFQNKATASFVGTVNYMAPEVIRGQVYGSQADIWSVGATVIEMLTGKPPYYDWAQLNIIFKIGNEGKIEFKYPDGTSVCLLDFIDMCLQPNPIHRPTSEELLKHDFLFENYRGL